jgi:hypothetical protein
MFRRFLLYCIAAWIPAYAGMTLADEPAAVAPSVQDMWWAGEAESGWGVSIIQHGEKLFCVLYVYDYTAHTTWFVVPTGTWNESRTTYRGAAYHPRGVEFYNYDTAHFDPGLPFGEITIEFASPNEAILTYRLDVYTGAKRITRQPYGTQGPVHVSDVTDMWWGGPSQSGWGVSIVQHFDSLFIVWFTYFLPNRGVPTWFVMPGGTWTGPKTYEGRIYRPFGSTWLGVNFSSSRIYAPDNGPFRLTFEDRDHAILEVSVLDHTATLALTRQPF